MEKLNMAKVNTLFKKGYLLAGVMMAANMFVLNEVKASSDMKTGDTNKQEELFEIEGKEKIEEEKKKRKDAEEKNENKAWERRKKKGKSGLKSFLGFLSSYENTINLIGGAVLSAFNNYTKWWDYNPGCYGQFGCIGWKSKRFLYGVLQFEVNLNAVKGILWLIPDVFSLQQYKKEKENSIIFKKSTAGLIAMKTLNKGKKIDISNKANVGIFYFIIFLFQGFVSMPLTFHISNFSISISLDSMILGGIGMYLGRNDGKEGNQEINDESLSNSIKGKDQNQQNNVQTENIKLDDSKDGNEESHPNIK